MSAWLVRYVARLRAPLKPRSIPTPRPAHPTLRHRLARLGARGGACAHVESAVCRWRCRYLLPASEPLTVCLSLFPCARLRSWCTCALAGPAQAADLGGGTARAYSDGVPPRRQRAPQLDVTALPSHCQPIACVVVRLPYARAPPTPPPPPPPPPRNRHGHRLYYFRRPQIKIVASARSNAGKRRYVDRQRSSVL